jgi:hypothetical protein
MMNNIFTLTCHLAISERDEIGVPYHSSHVPGFNPFESKQCMPGLGQGLPLPRSKGGAFPFLLTQGVPHRFRKCRSGITVFTRGTQETPGFHAGQSSMVCEACPGARRLALCAIPHMCGDSNLSNVIRACQVWARGTTKKDPHALELYITLSILFFDGCPKQGSAADPPGVCTWGMPALARDD